MRRIPVSLVFFLFTAFAFALQAIPVIGIFLMMLAAPFWSVILVNLGFLGIGLEAWRGRISTLWLVLPILWFGGHTVFAAREHLALAAIRSEIAAFNQGAAIPFDPAAQSLVFVEQETSVWSGMAGWLVQNYHLPAAYERQTAGAGGRTLAFRLARQEECRRVRSANVGGAGIHAFGFHDGDGGWRNFVTDFCMLRMYETPPARSQVELSARETRTTDRGLEIVHQTIAIRAPDGRVRELRTGHASLLSWVPRPVIGCGLGSSRWQCFAGFYRQGFVSLTPGQRYRSREELVARALGLRRMPPSERGAAGAPQTQAQLARAEAQALAGDVAQLETVLRDPLAEIDAVPFRLLRTRPPALAPYAGRIVDTLERTAPLGIRTRDNGHNLAALAAVLPADDFARLGPRILALYRRHPGEHWMSQTGPLLARTGDLGVAALPALLASLDYGRIRANPAAVTGLCRIGRPAAPAAGARLLRHWRARNGERLDDGDRALYAALLRLGLREAVGPVEQRYRRDWYRDAWRTIGPASPRDVCDPL